MIRLVIPGDPRGKERAKPSTRIVDGVVVHRHYTPKATVAYESLVRIVAAEAMRGEPPWKGAVHVALLMVYPVAASWSKKRQAAALAGTIRPTRSPDCDNVLKAISDGCNKVVFVDDRQIVEVLMRKVYGDRPRVVVELRQI